MSNENPKKEFLFNKRNYRFLLLSIALIAIGFIIMAGGGSEDPMFLTLKFLISAELDWHPPLFLWVLDWQFIPF